MNQSAAPLTTTGADPVSARLSQFASQYGDMVSGAVGARSISLAESFQQQGGDTPQETQLWSLLSGLLKDCERTPSYLPDVIGLSLVQRHRRWYISHGAHVQDLLQRNTLLRRMNIVLSWLEQIYQPAASTTLTTTRVRGSDTEEEAVLLRRCVFAHIRGGEHHRAVEAAEVARDAMLACILATAQVQTTFERWHNHTALVPLFGEYGNGEGDFASNEHRLTNIVQLFNDCETLKQKKESLSTTEQLDFAIAAALSGHADLTAYCTTQGGWRDVLWSVLRRVLIRATSKAITNNGEATQASPFTTAIDNDCRPQEPTLFTQAHSWDQVMSRKALDTINDLLCRHLQGLAPEAAASAEALQMRVVLYFLNSAVDESRRDDTRTRWLVSINTPLQQRTADDIRRVAHVLLCMDAAHGENLLHAPLQEAKTFVDAVSLHAATLAQGADLSLSQTVEWVIGMAMRLVSDKSRAAVYSAFLIAARVRCFAENMTPIEVEEQDRSLLHSIRGADPSPVTYAALCSLLTGALNDESLPKVTVQSKVDALLYRLLATSNCDVIKLIVVEGLQLCLLLSREGQLDAVGDLVRILLQHGAGQLRHGTASSTTTAAHSVDLSPEQLHELFFWEHVVRVRTTSEDHMRCISRYGLRARAEEHAAAFSESQQELLQRRALLDATRQVLHQLRGPARALLERHPNDIAACASWVCRTYTEGMTLTASMANATASVVLVGLQQVFSLVEELDHLGLMERGVTPQETASALFAAVATLRQLYGQMITKEMVTAKLA